MMNPQEELELLRVQVAQLNGLVQHLMHRVGHLDFEAPKFELDDNPRYIRYVMSGRSFGWAYNPNYKKEKANE